MTTVISPSSILGDLVTTHPGLARPMERHGLDYCCGGQRTLADACQALGLDVDDVVADLANEASGPPASWADLGPADLVDHIVATHHAYLHEELPRIAALAAKVHGVHGVNHPELGEVAATFTELHHELDPHLAKEEQVLFPMICELAAADQPPSFHCGSLRNPISVMLREHDHAGELLERLRTATSGYTVPADGCASYAALYQALDELEADTHMHVHIENNHLFPMVVDLEDSVRASAGVAP